MLLCKISRIHTPILHTGLAEAISPKIALVSHFSCWKLHLWLEPKHDISFLRPVPKLKVRVLRAALAMFGPLVVIVLLVGVVAMVGFVVVGVVVTLLVVVASPMVLLLVSLRLVGLVGLFSTKPA